MSNGIPRKLALAAFFLASAYSSAYSTAVYAADEAIQIAEEASESARSSVEQRTALVDKTARKVTDIRAALMAYYTDKTAWPASLDLLVAGGYYPKADWSTPYGNIAGAINGTSYVLSLTLPNGSRATPIGKLIAAKANGTASGSNNTDLTFTIGTPSQASIVKNMLSRVKDPNNAMANTMETDINMNGNNILDTGTVTADIFDGTTAKISGKTTTGQLEVGGSTLALGDAVFAENVNIKKALIADGATVINNTLNVAGKTTLADADVNSLAVKGAQSVAGTSTLNGATAVNNTLKVTGKATLADADVNNLAVKGAQTVTGTSTMHGATTVNNTLKVTGTTTLANTSVADLYVNGQLTNVGAMYLRDALVVDGTTTLKGATVVQNKLTVNNGARISGLAELDTLQVNQNGQVAGTFGVTGKTTLADLTAANAAFTGNVSINGTHTVAGVSTLNGATTVNNTLKVTGKTTLADADVNTLAVKGNQTVAGTLGVTGKTTLVDMSAVNGTFSGSTTVAGNHTVNGTTNLNGVTNVNNALNVTGKTTLADADVNNLAVKGNQTVAGTLRVEGATVINDTLDVTGKTTLADMSAVNGTFSGSTTVAGNHTVNGTTNLNGATSVNNTLKVTGASTLADLSAVNANFSGSTAVAGNHTVNGISILNGVANLNNALNVAGVSTLNGATTINNVLRVTGKATLADADVNTLAVKGNETVAGTLNVGGATILNGSLNAGQTSLSGLTVMGGTTLNGDLIGTNATFSGTVTAKAVKADTLGYKDGGAWKDVATEINALKAADTALDGRVDSLEAWRTTTDTTLKDHERRIVLLENKTDSGSSSGTWTTLYSNATGTTSYTLPASVASAGIVRATYYVKYTSASHNSTTSTSYLSSFTPGEAWSKNFTLDNYSSVCSNFTYGFSATSWYSNNNCSTSFGVAAAYLTKLEIFK